MHMQEKGRFTKLWRIEKWHNSNDRLSGVPPYETVEFSENLLLNEGIALLWDLAIGAGGTPWNNANAYLGVGDSSVAEAATQTGLQAATNKLYKAMDATYPQRTNQTVAWRATFGTAEANWVWNEASLSNAVGGDTGVNLNRKVQAMGTKTSGDWTLTLEITLS